MIISLLRKMILIRVPTTLLPGMIMVIINFIVKPMAFIVMRKKKTGLLKTTLMMLKTGSHGKKMTTTPWVKKPTKCGMRTSETMLNTL